jgi:hypothetical protein
MANNINFLKNYSTLHFMEFSAFIDIKIKKIDKKTIKFNNYK